MGGSTQEASGPCWAIVLAGGSGRRLGAEKPKSFVSLAGRPLLAWSVEALARHPAITDLITVVPRDWTVEAQETVLEPLRRDGDAPACRLHAPIVGGRRRQDSALAGLEAAVRLGASESVENVPVLVHDAARPIVAPGLIDALLLSLQKACRNRTGVGGAIPVVPVGDTLKTVRSGGKREIIRLEGRIGRTVPRAGLWRVQTPQVFHLGPALEAHREAQAAGFQATDDAMLFEWMGWPVEVTPGSPLGLKVTYTEELALLEGWLQTRDLHARPEAAQP